MTGTVNDIGGNVGDNNVRREIDKLWKEVNFLRRYLLPDGIQEQKLRYEITWTYPGVLIAGTYSPKFTVPFDAYLWEVECFLVTAPTGTTTIHCYRDAANQVSTLIQSGETAGTSRDINKSYSADQNFLQFFIHSFVGSPTDLTCVARFV